MDLASIDIGELRKYCYELLGISAQCECNDNEGTDPNLWVILPPCPGWAHADHYGVQLNSIGSMYPGVVDDYFSDIWSKMSLHIIIERSFDMSRRILGWLGGSPLENTDDSSS